VLLLLLPCHARRQQQAPHQLLHLLLLLSCG
jgi:hypothetical protein